MSFRSGRATVDSDDWRLSGQDKYLTGAPI